jgi:predicted phosphodiesterase
LRLHILSDLHLGRGEFEAPAVDADVVILAGDVARPYQAISFGTRFSQPVLFVAGNHEFYGGSIGGVRGELKQLAAGTNVSVLDCDQAVIGGVRFLGATLWTDFDLYGDARRKASMDEALRWVRDFTRIRRDEEPAAPFTPEDSADLFRTHAGWLAARLAEPHPGPTVVITHHSPSPGSIHPRFADSPLNPCFVSDAEHLLAGGRAALWIHGHTHDSFDYLRNGTRIVCNPRGYAQDGINENPLFDPMFTVDVP